MPDRDVKNLRQLIWYQYAKIIARSVLGPDAKKEGYGLIKTKFRALCSGTITWSDITRDDKQLVEAPKQCFYCGAQTDLVWEHLVPKSLRINERCASCDTIQAIHNQVWSCRVCNSSKGTLGLYTFYRCRLAGDRKFYDRLPPLAEKKYLKTVYECLDRCTPCLDAEQPGGQPQVLDLDRALQQYGHL